MGIDISLHSDVGPGFYIGHYGGIVVGAHIIIGRNCNISQGVTLGITNRGKRAGVPTLGDNVYIAPGAKIIGNITIGDRAAIGANAVVVCDVPATAVVVGVPARVISFKGSDGYINNQWGQEFRAPELRPLRP
jgi:serine O-acetyltransferase